MFLKGEPVALSGVRSAIETGRLPRCYCSVTIMKTIFPFGLPRQIAGLLLLLYCNVPFPRRQLPIALCGRFAQGWYLGPRLFRLLAYP